MSGEKESDDPNASEEKEDGKEQGEDEILHLKTKLREMAKEADSKMLRVACRLILKSLVFALLCQISGMQSASTFANLLLKRRSM